MTCCFPARVIFLSRDLWPCCLSTNHEPTSNDNCLNLIKSKKLSLESKWSHYLPVVARLPCPSSDGNPRCGIVGEADNINLFQIINLHPTLNRRAVNQLCVALLCNVTNHNAGNGLQAEKDGWSLITHKKGKGTLKGVFVSVEKHKIKRVHSKILQMSHIYTAHFFQSCAIMTLSSCLASFLKQGLSLNYEIKCFFNIHWIWKLTFPLLMSCFC